jgi:virulence factor Mce-like protein
VHRALAGTVLAVVIVAAVVIVLRYSYGYYANPYTVSGVFPNAGMGISQGSEVKYRGLTVGRVKSIRLDGYRARLELSIDHGTRIPADATADIEPNTFFGDEFVSLSSRGTSPKRWLGDGDTIHQTTSGTTISDLVAEGDELLGRLDLHDAATVLTELNEGLSGEGKKLGHLLDQAAATTLLFHDTLDAQQQALSALARFTDAARDLGPTLNGITGAANPLLATFNQARSLYVQALTTFRPLADNLASLLAVNRPSLDAILGEGGNVVRALVAHRKDVADTIYGISEFLYTVTEAGTSERMSDGAHFLYVKDLVLFSDVQKILCSIIGAPQPSSAPGAAQLHQLQEAFLTQQGLLDCSAYVNPPPLPAPGRGGGTTASASPTPAPAPAPAQGATDAVYGQLSQPDTSRGVDLGRYLQLLLGGAP